MEKLRVEQTKSRAYHSGDNGLVEAKNGAIIRKHKGFGHIDAKHAEAIDRFHREHLNPYVNFHRPCAVPQIITAPNGKRRRIYTRWATPWELLQEAAKWKNFLKPNVTVEEMEQRVAAQTDTEAALASQQAKRQLRTHIRKRSA
jgi:hypothetical protein